MAYLDQVCGSEPTLRACVESLLTLDDEPSDWLRGGIERATAEIAQAQSWEQRRLGPFRVLEELGEGGMGAVYLARREDGEVEQEVAIKVVGRGPLTADLRRRFLVERQILARLDHPNIARFLDGGTAQEGTPYLVMERVKGERITAYCRRRQLGVRQRLRLFMQVLDAVDYAHRNLVVHRDLKPSNIFVTEDGIVKLLDFGIAKLLGDEVDDGLTRTNQHLMTPDYASPEQLLGNPVTTASDVYALGVVLYRLLAEKRPFSRRRAESALANLSDDPPELPSRAARQHAAELRGDLDRIVIKSVAFHPRERYGTAGDLAGDLDRYLKHEPVSAMPPSATYQMRKFLRRHRRSVLAAALVVLALGWGLAAKSLEARAARRAELETQAVVDFLVGLFTDSKPGQIPGSAPTVIELLHRGADQAEAELSDSPRVRARLLQTVGEALWGLGEYPRAAEMLEQALALRSTIFGPEHPRVGDSLFHLSKAYQLLGEDERAESALVRCLVIREQVGDELGVASVLDELSVLYRHLGRHQEAATVIERALEIRNAHPESSRASLASSLNHLGTLLCDQDRCEEAWPSLQRSLELRRELLGPDHPDIATALNGVAIAAAKLGRSEAARGYFLESLEMRQRIMPASHSSLAQSYSNLAQISLQLEQPDDARSYLERAIAVWTQGPNPNPRHSGLAWAVVGDLETAAQRPEEAEKAYRHALTTLEQGLETGHPAIAVPLRGLGDLARAGGQPEQALALYRRALEILRPRRPAGHSELEQLETSIAECLQEAGR
ncbi:MAG: serine/threonine-protein kinase [Acidobacteriota bacterium]